MYHIMYWQGDQEFCPMCSMWVDGWDGIAHHVAQNANIVAATLAPVDKLQAWKAHRKWQRIRVLADADSSFARDLDLSPSGRGDLERRQRLRDVTGWSEPARETFRGL
jgi:predicted dithiol-disulfide oxidoreductase (DUF899 family)